MKSLEEIVEMLKDEIQEIMMENYYADDMSNDSHFVNDFNFDSLDYAYIVLSGEAFVQGKLNENKVVWKELQTIGQMAKALYECQND